MDKNDARYYAHADVTGTIIAAAYEVSNALGCGFLEKVYENSLVVELRRRGLQVRQQVPIQILYREQIVGDYVADLIVEGLIIIEVKATLSDEPVFKAQILNYLRATGLPVGLLLNFGRPKVSVTRLVLPDYGAVPQVETDILP